MALRTLHLEHPFRRFKVESRRNDGVHLGNGFGRSLGIQRQQPPLGHGPLQGRRNRDQIRRHRPLLAFVDRVQRPGPRGHARHRAVPGLGRARLDEDRAQIVALGAFARQHRAAFGQPRRRRQHLKPRLVFEPQRRQKPRDPLDPVGRERIAVLRGGPQIGLSRGIGHRKPRQQQREHQKRGAKKGRQRRFHVLEEPHHHDLDQKDRADRHAKGQVHHGPGGQFDLVGPEPRNHVPHQQHVDAHEQPAQCAVQVHQRPGGRTDMALFVERELPEVEHQEGQDDRQQQEDTAENGVDGRAHDDPTLCSV